MTTTELIKILQDNEKGGISHKSRQISLTVNGRYLPEPQITISSTGDGIVGPEIDLDVDGEWFDYEADGTDEVVGKKMTQKQKYDVMMTLARACENRSMEDMHISTMCCIAENTAIIADALSSRQQDSDAVHLAKRICEIAKKNTDGDMAMTEIAYLLQDEADELYHANDFKQYFENRRKKTS